MADAWFYSQNDVRKGPVDFETLKALAENGTIGPDSFVWKTGFPQWKSVSSIPSVFAEPPPLPSPDEPPPLPCSNVPETERQPASASRTGTTRQKPPEISERSADAATVTIISTPMNFTLCFIGGVTIYYDGQFIGEVNISQPINLPIKTTPGQHMLLIKYRMGIFGKTCSYPHVVQGPKSYAIYMEFDRIFSSIKVAQMSQIDVG